MPGADLRFLRTGTGHLLYKENIIDMLLPAKWA
jgi:hypothetical protein